MAGYEREADGPGTAIHLYGRCIAAIHDRRCIRDIPAMYSCGIPWVYSQYTEIAPTCPYRARNVQHALIKYAICAFAVAKVHVAYFISANYGYPLV